MSESIKTAVTWKRYVRFFGLVALVFLCNYLAGLFFGTSLAWKYCIVVAVFTPTLIDQFIKYQAANFLLIWLIQFGTCVLGFCIAWYLKFSDLGIFLMLIFFAAGMILPALYMERLDKHHDSTDDPADESTPGQN